MKKITFFLLTIALTFCGVSYAQETVILEEDFEDGVIPATWTATQGAATEGWQVSTNGSGGNFNLNPQTPPTNYAWVNDSSCDCDMSDVRLSTPAIDLTGYSVAILEFNTFYAIWDSMAATPDNLSFEYSIDGGTNWVLIGDMNPDEAWNWNIITVDASALTGNSDVRFSFHYDDAGFQAYGWAIDDFKIFEPTAVEASVTNLLPIYVVANEPFKPVVEILSDGANTLNDIDVFYELMADDGVTVLESHFEQFTGLNINFGETKLLESPAEWTAAVGNYKVKASINVTGDADTTNNDMEVDTEAVTVDYSNIVEGEGYMALPGELQKINVAASGTTTINAFPEATYYAGMDFVGDKLYAIENELDFVTFEFTDKLHLISGDGTQYDLGEMKFVGASGLTNGMAYDETSGITYVTGKSGGGPAFLAALNFNTLEATFITNIGTMDQLYSAIEFDDNGVLYGNNFAVSRIDIIDKVTGAVTPMPNGTGFPSVSLNLDLAFNDVNDVLYGTFNASPNAMFGSINTTTGVVTELFQTNDMNAALISYPSTTTLSVNDNELLAFEMYPNPTQDYLHIKSLTDFNYTIYGLEGKLLLEGSINGNTAIDVSGLSTSTYFIRIEDNNTKSYQTKKFIKF